MSSSIQTVSSEVENLLVIDSKGDHHLFSSLYKLNDQFQSKQTLFIFIRHFFCGHCKEFICALSAKDGITDEELKNANKSLIIIGCGQSTLIEKYKDETKCPFPIYCDPTRQIYDALGMIQSLSLGEKNPDYIKSSFLVNITKSTLSALTSGQKMFHGGNISQNGGEYLIDQSGSILWSHAMNNTRDHSEILKLKEILFSRSS